MSKKIDKIVSKSIEYKQLLELSNTYAEGGVVKMNSYVKECRYNLTILMLLSAKRETRETIKKTESLLRFGANPNILSGDIALKDSWEVKTSKQDALHFATLAENFEIAKILLKNGANIENKHRTYVREKIIEIQVINFNENPILPPFKTSTIRYTLQEASSKMIKILLNNPKKINENSLNLIKSDLLNKAFLHLDIELLKIYKEIYTDINIYTNRFGEDENLEKFIVHLKNNSEKIEEFSNYLFTCIDLNSKINIMNYLYIKDSQASLIIKNILINKNSLQDNFNIAEFIGNTKFFLDSYPMDILKERVDQFSYDEISKLIISLSSYYGKGSTELIDFLCRGKSIDSIFNDIQKTRIIDNAFFLSVDSDCGEPHTILKLLIDKGINFNILSDKQLDDYIKCIIDVLGCFKFKDCNVNYLYEFIEGSFNTFKILQEGGFKFSNEQENKIKEQWQKTKNICSKSEYIAKIGYLLGTENIKDYTKVNMSDNLLDISIKNNSDPDHLLIGESDSFNN